MNETKYNTFCSSSKAEAVVSEGDIDYIFGSIYRTNISNIQENLEKGLGWIIDLVTVNVSKYKLLSDRRFFFTEKITPSKKGLFFKTLMIMNALNGVWSKTYLLQIMIKIRKVDKTFARELEFEDIKFPKIIRDIHKIEKEKNYIAIDVFGYENKKKNIQSMCQKIEKTYILFQKTF